MKTSLRMLLASSLALSFTLLAGCGPEADLSSSEDALDRSPASLASRSQGLVSTTGIRVSATYQEVITGTPTYGDPATSPQLRVHVEVDDAALRSVYPSFDGLERVAVRVPKLRGGSLVWDTIALSYSGQTRRGYYGDIPIDLHDSPAIWGVDFPTLSRLGVALFLDTNLGVIWAQNEGQNYAVTRK